MSVPIGVVRWKFTEADDDTHFVRLTLNPNTMSTPTNPRSMTWAWGSKAGYSRMRGFDGVPQTPTQWTFGGVILTKDHYDQLLDWAGRLKVLRVDDHIGRAYSVMITKYDPVERLPTATKPWRADYTMTCLLLERIA